MLFLRASWSPFLGFFCAFALVKHLCPSHGYSHALLRVPFGSSHLFFQEDMLPLFRPWRPWRLEENSPVRSLVQPRKLPLKYWRYLSMNYFDSNSVGLQRPCSWTHAFSYPSSLNKWMARWSDSWIHSLSTYFKTSLEMEDPLNCRSLAYNSKG